MLLKMLIELIITQITQATTFAITDPLSRAVISKYYNCFPPAEREASVCKGEFNRVLNSKNQPTQKVVGINPIGNFGKDIAKYLNKPNWNSFTCHAFRRTGATLLAENNCSIPLLKIAGSWIL
jgi:integrase